MSQHTRQTATPTTSDQTSVNVRFYQPGDEEAILHVLQASFPRWPEVETSVAPIDHLRWKLASAPHPELNHIVAEARGEIIAVRIGWAQRYSGRLRALTCRLDVDSAVLPDWRGRGVYSDIARFGVEMATDADAVFASTGRPSLLQLDRELGHHAFKNRLVSMTCDVAAQPDERIERDWAVSAVSSFNERIESFWRTASRPFDFIATPSRAELTWRYCDVRSGIGTALQAEESGEVVGFAALRLSHGKGYIAYLLALPERLDIVQGLIAESLTRLRAAGVREVACALPTHHPYRTLLIEAGFSSKGHTVPLTCRPNGRHEPDLSFLQHPKAALHLMLGDTDLV